MEPSKPPTPSAHAALRARLADCLAGKIVSDPRTEPDYRRILGLDGGPWRETASDQAMLVASWVWRAYLLLLLPTGDLKAFTAALQEHLLAMAQVERLYALEREQGMCRAECLYPDPHAGLHLEAHVALLLVAVESGGPKLHDLALDWLGRALRLYNALASPDGEPFAPGLRARTGVPRNRAAAALLREVLGLRHRREDGKVATAKELAAPGSGSTPDSYRALRWLRRLCTEDRRIRPRLRELATSGPFPQKLLLPLRVVRFDGGLLASLRQPAEPPRNEWPDPVDWVLVHWRRPGRHEVQVGRNWQTPAPDVPGEALIIGEG